VDDHGKSDFASHFRTLEQFLPERKGAQGWIMPDNARNSHATAPAEHTPIKGEVAGSFLLGLMGSFHNLRVLPQDAPTFHLDEILPDHWYPYAVLMDTIHAVEKAFPASASLFFRAGIHFIRIWYDHGPGKTMIHSGLDWLYANKESGGYNSVVRGGSPEEIGWCRLLSMDEAAGIAIQENVMPLTPDYVKGVFYGGCVLFDDMDFVDVEETHEPYLPNPAFTRTLVTVRFHLKNRALDPALRHHLDRLRPGAPTRLTDEEVQSLLWRHRGLEVQARLDRAYYGDISTILADALTTSQRILQDLESAKAAAEAAFAALQRSETKHRTLYETSRDAIMTLFPPEWKFTAGNPAAMEMFGAQSEEAFISLGPSDLSPECQPDGELTAVKASRVIETAMDHGSHFFEWVHRTIGGSEFPATVLLTRIELDGKAGLQATVRDISQQKQTEAIVRARNEELKGFAYTVSHDLKAPLRGIAGYSSELERKHRDGLSERAQYCIAQILTATRNLDQLIGDLLHYSRMDAETPTPSSVNLRGLVGAILEDRKLVMEEMQVGMTVKIPSITLETWERGLSQTLSNLIDNALKYSRKARPPRLSITAEVIPGGCRIAVADNGIGFDMKYHDRIFGLFNRLVRANEFEGTGAGLAIVKKLVEKLGGTIRAESAPNLGATFFLELPDSLTQNTSPVGSLHLARPL
jgi:PAS domain S-box-containing protein